jgi:RNA polymerase-binding transcription factor DksA
MSAVTQLSVPEAGSLGPEALAALRALVVDQLHASAEQAAAHERTARELADHTDPDSVIERELAESCAVRARAALADAELALRRFHVGTYGICEVCRAPIPFERLEAIPHARRCVACPSTGAGILAASGMRGRPERVAP